MRCCVIVTKQIPLNAVWGMVLGAFVLGMPMLDNITTFTAVTSIATIGESAGV